MSWKSKVNYGIIKHKIIGPDKKQFIEQTHIQQHSNIRLLPNTTPPANSNDLISTRTSWPPSLFKKYHKDLEDKGFKIGARVKTIYERTGVIVGYREEEESVTFFGHKAPNCIQLRMDGAALITPHSVVYYNEDELELINA